jgi:hypothetical protein
MIALTSLVAFIQRTDPLFQALVPLSQFIDLIRPRCGKQVLFKSRSYSSSQSPTSLHLRLEVDQLTLHIVKPSDLFRKRTLKGRSLGVEVSKLDAAEFS